MTPVEVDALDDDTYRAFVRHMQREARALEAASKKGRRR
jgi:hypothetical protein